MSLPLIVVVGATGAQGGSVINHLLNSKKYKIRGTTRDPNSAKAKDLQSKGVEVVKADIGNKDDLKHAFAGAYGVYAVTNFWDPEISFKNPSLEEKQGRLMADVAKEAGVQHYVWSSLHDADNISGGKLHVPHFSGKNRVEQYVKSLKFPYSTFVYAGFYANNFGSFFKASMGPDGTAIFAYPIGPEVQLPIYDVEDSGAFVAAAFDHKEEHNGKKILMATEYLTLPQVVEIYTKVTQKPAKYVHVNMEDFKKSGAPEEFVNTMIWFNEYGYYNKEDISGSRKISSNLTTFEQWLKKSGWTVQ